MHAQLSESIAQTFRMDGARRQRPRLILWCGRVRKKIGNRDAVNRLCRMTSEPTQDVGFEAALGENIPDRLDLTRCARDWPNAAVLRVRLHESVDAMLVRPFPGSNRIPQHGGKDRSQGRQIPHHTMVDE